MMSMLIVMNRMLMYIACVYIRTDQRVRNHMKDMSHAHLLETRLRPELSVKPSALWQKRQVHDIDDALMIIMMEILTMNMHFIS